MYLKKETRILIIDRLDNFIIGLVVRGIAGIENSIIFKNCNELYSFLMQKTGIAGEVNYIMLNRDICTELKLALPNIKNITVSDVKDGELLAEIKEVLRILHSLALKYSAYVKQDGI